MTVQVPSRSGGEFSAYLALPIRPGPAIVVLQEIFGVSPFIRGVCDFLASRQFVAIAPDLFSRSGRDVTFTEADIENARATRMKTDDNTASDDAADTLAFIRKHPHCTGRAGVSGYCWGGLISYLTATQHKPDAAACYYGVGIEKRLETAGGLACPTVFHFAGQDQYAGPDVAAKVREAFTGDKRVTIHEYPKAGHAFARKTGAHYDPAATDLADMRSLSFFVEHLVGPRK